MIQKWRQKPKISKIQHGSYEACLEENSGEVSKYSILIWERSSVLKILLRIHSFSGRKSLKVVNSKFQKFKTALLWEPLRSNFRISLKLSATICSRSRVLKFLYLRSYVNNKRPMGLGALLNNQLGHGPKFQKLHLCSLPIPGCRIWAFFCSMGSSFQDNGWFSKLPYLGMKLARLAIGQNSRGGIYTLFYPEAQT